MDYYATIKASDTFYIQTLRMSNKFIPFFFFFSVFFFYVHVGKKLSTEYPHSGKDYRKYMKEAQHSFVFL